MELYQQAKNGEQRHFAVKAGRELHVTHSRNQKTSRYAFSILALRDRGKRVYSYNRRWLLLALLSAGALLSLPVLSLRLEGDGLGPYYLYLMLGLFCVALLFFLLLAKSFQRSYVFHSVHTGLPLAELWVNMPSRGEFQKFIHALEENIRHHKVEMKVSFNRQLAGEMRTLRRVTEAGMLSESVYQAAKAKLLIMSDENYRPPSQQD